MRDREVTLIGGEFHRRKVKVRANQFVVNVALPAVLKVNPEIDDGEYTHLPCAIYRVFPFYFGKREPVMDLFFLEGIDPELWLKNLVLDYIK